MDYTDYNGAAKPYYPEISIWQKSILSPLFSSAHKNRPFELPALSDDLLDLALFLEEDRKKTRLEGRTNTSMGVLSLTWER